MSESEKAKKYDEIAAIVASFYTDEEDAEPDDSLGDLGDLGEKIAIYFGYL